MKKYSAEVVVYRTFAIEAESSEEARDILSNELCFDDYDTQQFHEVDDGAWDALKVAADEVLD